MPKTTKRGKPKRSGLPDTFKRSPKKAKRQFAKTPDSAAEQYAEGRRAHRIRLCLAQHDFEKTGGHWEPKDESGAPDPRSEKSTKQKQHGKGETLGGVDYEDSTRQTCTTGQRNSTSTAAPR